MYNMNTINSDFYKTIESNLVLNINTNLEKDIKLPSVDKNILINMHKFKKDLNIETFFQDEQESDENTEAESEGESEGETDNETPGANGAGVNPNTPEPTPAPTAAPTPAPTTVPVRTPKNIDFKFNADVEEKVEHNYKVLDHCKRICSQKLYDKISSQ